MPSMIWRSSSVGPVSRFLSLRQVRFRSNIGTCISDFAIKKKGTGTGCFIELPDFVPLQDSILVKIPSSCEIYGKMNKINAISSDASVQNEPLLAQESVGTVGFSRIVTGEHPANLIMASPTPMSNIAVVKIDSGENDGMYVPEFDQSVLCYSGNLMLRNNNQITGYGVVALAGRGPVYQVILREGEHMVVASESILAYDSQAQIRLIRLQSPYRSPSAMYSFFSRYFQRYYDQVLMKLNKSFATGRVFSKIQGPGTFFLQTQFVPGSRKYLDEELLQITKSEA
ncbi:hypothetical protein HG536_0E03180 [Torulaspora globosa]|uniref:Altered inheritance of mitochondria protein 24, mitochondrial n=1 Tax=Torulaspora globosa TaxID=48254 RepID=A0A7G3ZIS1_9SACH|nr:uncharacterized protein HG536_0E03180 [Torulaspora globosa]QLL33407.1 hypothetical protein HG536_0E03180 [Torulaspora globosa]